MVIFLNLDGTAEKVSPERVYRGSNNVTNVDVVAPFPSTTALTIGFVLPTGLETDYRPMRYAEQTIAPALSVWTYALPATVTQDMGDLYVAINAITLQGNTTSYLCKIVVEDSVLPTPPPEPEPDVYQLILLYLQQLDARTQNVKSAIQEVRQTAPNAFDTVTLGGTVSAPIVITAEGETPPSPIMATGVVSVSADAWEPYPSVDDLQGYATTVTAAQHGQMKDGATAADLWVSFDEIDDLIANGTYKRNEKNAAGDITIYVNQPVALIVRVWNGKGLQGKDGGTGPKGVPGNSIYRCVIPLRTDQPNVIPLSYILLPPDHVIAVGNLLFSSANGVYAVVTDVTTDHATATGLYDASGYARLPTTAFTADGWTTVNDPLGALSKAITVPSGQRVVCVLDNNNQPRGTWRGSTIYANAAFAGVVLTTE